MREAFQNLGYGLLLSVVLLYLVLAGQFRSFADPLLILVAVPLGLMGVLATLWVTHTALNVQSFIGIIFMVGIAVSNSILLIKFANRELEAGKQPRKATRDCKMNNLKISRRDGRETLRPSRLQPEPEGLHRASTPCPALRCRCRSSRN